MRLQHENEELKAENNTLKEEISHLRQRAGSGLQKLKDCIIQSKQSQHVIEEQIRQRKEEMRDFTIDANDNEMQQKAMMSDHDAELEKASETLHETLRQAEHVQGDLERDVITESCRHCTPGANCSSSRSSCRKRPLEESERQELLKQAAAQAARATKFLERTGMKQLFLANKVGCSQGTLSSWLKLKYAGDTSRITARVQAVMNELEALCPETSQNINQHAPPPPPQPLQHEHVPLAAPCSMSVSSSYNTTTTQSNASLTPVSDPTGVLPVNCRRKNFTREQVEKLVQIASTTPNPTNDVIEHLSASFGREQRHIVKWFSNWRTRKLSKSNLHLVYGESFPSGGCMGSVSFDCGSGQGIMSSTNMGMCDANCKLPHSLSHSSMESIDVIPGTSQGMMSLPSSPQQLSHSSAGYQIHSDHLGHQTDSRSSSPSFCGDTMIMMNTGEGVPLSLLLQGLQSHRSFDATGQEPLPMQLEMQHQQLQQHRPRSRPTSPHFHHRLPSLPSLPMIHQSLALSQHNHNNHNNHFNHSNHSNHSNHNQHSSSSYSHYDHHSPASSSSSIMDSHHQAQHDPTTPTTIPHSVPFFHELPPPIPTLSASHPQRPIVFTHVQMPDTKLACANQFLANDQISQSQYNQDSCSENYNNNDNLNPTSNLTTNPTTNEANMDPTNDDNDTTNSPFDLLNPVHNLLPYPEATSDSCSRKPLS
eukprot:c6420_g1_i1.p1 GENE.c6420_g1_i1~~c6420_g1_i1.p1  ORF type:complete len:705 (-),score=89.48 c6420_g1_i1:396-2510(-)